MKEEVVWSFSHAIRQPSDALSRISSQHILGALNNKVPRDALNTLSEQLPWFVLNTPPLAVEGGFRRVCKKFPQFALIHPEVLSLRVLVTEGEEEERRRVIGQVFE